MQKALCQSALFVTDFARSLALAETKRHEQTQQLPATETQATASPPPDSRIQTSCYSNGATDEPVVPRIKSDTSSRVRASGSTISNSSSQHPADGSSAASRDSTIADEPILRKESTVLEIPAREFARAQTPDGGAGSGSAGQSPAAGVPLRRQPDAGVVHLAPLQGGVAEKEQPGIDVEKIERASGRRRQRLSDGEERWRMRSCGAGRLTRAGSGWRKTLSEQRRSASEHIQKPSDRPSSNIFNPRPPD